MRFKYFMLGGFLAGCNTGTPPVVDSCMDDMDCRNGYHCNAINQCTPDVIDDAGEMPMADAGMLPEDASMPREDVGMMVVDSGPMENDAGMFDTGTMVIDSGMVATPDSGTLPDAGYMPDAGPRDTWLRFNGGLTQSPPVVFAVDQSGNAGRGVEFTMEVWLNFNVRPPAVGDRIINAVNGRVKMEVVRSCHTGRCFDYLACTFVNYWGTVNNLFAPIESVSNDWHHVSCTRNVTGKGEMMIDGTLTDWTVNSTTVYVPPTELHPIEVSFVGSIDNLVIGSPFRSGNFVPPSRLEPMVSDIRSYPMNEGAGLIASDIVGSSDLTLSGDVMWGF